MKSNKVYVRFGEIPSDGISKAHRGDAILWEEKGVSVWDCVIANDTHYPILPDNPSEDIIADYFGFLFGNKRVFLVTGTELKEKGSGGEPLLKDVKVIKELTDIYNYQKRVFTK